ncbi:unnamed protein product [Ambrosiozyma monospora]|uniref:Unnamed protein product n=1 Tax=Ambrosiozyma monospora TaxID=43982 RepID=A0A9W6Z3W9_AMBMO|nr:unnamed protein product [Ambrosiozyma monospora]
MLMSGFSDSTFHFNNDDFISFSHTPNNNNNNNNNSINNSSASGNNNNNNTSSNIESLFDDDLGELYFQGLSASSTPFQPFSSGVESSLYNYQNHPTLTTTPSFQYFPSLDELPRISHPQLPQAQPQQPQSQQQVFADTRPLETLYEQTTDQITIQPITIVTNPDYASSLQVPTLQTPTQVMFPPATACSPPPQARSPNFSNNDNNSNSNNNLLSLRRPSMESDSGYKSSVNLTPYSETTEIVGSSSFSALEQPQFVSPYFDHQQQQQLKANIGFVGPACFESDNTDLSFHHHYPQQAQHQQEFRIPKRPSLPIGLFQSRSYELVRDPSVCHNGAIKRLLIEEESLELKEDKTKMK